MWVVGEGGHPHLRRQQHLRCGCPPSATRHAAGAPRRGRPLDTVASFPRIGAWTWLLRRSCCAWEGFDFVFGCRWRCLSWFFVVLGVLLLPGLLPPPPG